jgi:hypothetical protein
MRNGDKNLVTAVTILACVVAAMPPSDDDMHW